MITRKGLFSHDANIKLRAFDLFYCATNRHHWPSWAIRNVLQYLSEAESRHRRVSTVIFVSLLFYFYDNAFRLRCEWTRMVLLIVLWPISWCRLAIIRFVFLAVSGAVSRGENNFRVMQMRCPMSKQAPTLNPWPRSMSSMNYLRTISPSNGSSQGSSRITCRTLSTVFDDIPNVN